jgi:two-component system sensor histidine kinase YesM
LIAEMFAQKTKVNLNKNEVGCISVFAVRDNGIGIAGPRLNDIKNSIMELKPDNDTMGLVNVQKRCRLLFGSDYGISISSSYGKGTEVRLRLPKD